MVQGDQEEHHARLTNTCTGSLTKRHRLNSQTLIENTIQPQRWTTSSKSTTQQKGMGKGGSPEDRGGEAIRLLRASNASRALFLSEDVQQDLKTGLTTGDGEFPSTTSNCQVQARTEDDVA